MNTYILTFEVTILRPTNPKRPFVRKVTKEIEAPNLEDATIEGTNTAEAYDGGDEAWEFVKIDEK